MLVIALAVVGAGCGDDDDSEPSFLGGPHAGSGGGLVTAGSGGSGPVKTGSGGTPTDDTHRQDLVCGSCAPSLEIEVKQPNGRPAGDWSAHIRGEGVDCTGTRLSYDCPPDLKAGDYDLDVRSGCSRWMKHVRIEAADPPPPGAICYCSVIPAKLELRKMTHDCDHDAGDGDAGVSEDAGL